MPKNTIKSGQNLTFKPSLGLAAFLEQLTDTHLYGKNPAETAHMIVVQEMKRLVLSGELDHLRARLPQLPTVADDDSSDAE